MTLTKLIRDSAQFCVIQKQYEAGTLAKSILCQTKDKMHASIFAKLLACLIEDGKACLECLSCQKVLLNSHPDVKSYPTKDKFLVADSQEIVYESFVKPVFSPKKVFIINSIDNSMESAQNKLLKVLEEPSENVYLILTCSDIEKVLPTIRSRCSKVELKKLSGMEIEQILPKCDNETKEVAKALGEGYIGKTISLAERADIFELCKCGVGIITSLTNSGQVLEYSKKMFSFGSLDLVLESATIALEDMLKIKAGKSNLVKYKVFMQELSFAADNTSVRAICEIRSRIDKAMEELAYNVNQNLVIENLLLNILEVKYICK